MKKKFILVLIITIFAFIPLANAQGTGFTVSSVSTSDVITRSTVPSEVFWIINTQFNGGGQLIAGTVNPETIKGFMGGNVYSKQPLSISVESANEEIFYEIINEGVPIYKYTLQTFDAPQSCPLYICYIYDNPPSCPSGTNWNIELGKSLFQFSKKRYCITKAQIGVKGVYNNPTISFKAKIKASAGNITKEKTICSGGISGCDGSSVDFDDLGVATWSGSLVTGEPAPNQDNFVAINNLTSNKWQIARKSTYEAYFPLISNTDSQLAQAQIDLQGYADVGQGDLKITTMLSPVQQATNTLLAENASFTSSPFTKDDNNGKVTVTVNRRLTSPNIVFRIRADWIGIVIPTGQPKILTVTSEKFQSGETGSIEVQVENIGEVAGTFLTKIENCDPFIQTSSSQTSRKTIQAGDIEIISVLISGGNISDKITKSCVVKVYDINDPRAEDSSSVMLQFDKTKICAPGQKFAAGNIIRQCSQDGSKTEIIEECPSGIVSDGKGGWTCNVKKDDNSKFQCSSNSECGELEYCNLDLKICVQKSSCIKVIENGDSAEKIDVAFVGDGYFDNQELKEDVLKIVDYRGDSGYNGLMSVEPFKSNKNKFNFWMIKAGNQIPLKENNGWKYIDRGKALEFAAECTAADYKIILSKKSFRSYASFNGEAYLSLNRADSLWGRLFLHEFGHAFGKLADEYVEPSLGNRPTEPNCAPDISTAQAWWGNFTGIEYAQGCSYVETNVRSTVNSIMRMQSRLEDDYGAVNEAALTKLLNQYR